MERKLYRENYIYSWRYRDTVGENIIATIKMRNNF